MSDRMEIRKQALRDLETSGREVTPKAVFEAARSKFHPLHNEFEWNGGLAIEALGILRAREIIRSIRVDVEYIDRGEIVISSSPVYTRDPDADPNSQGYVAVEIISTDEDRARRSLALELSMIEASIERALGLSVAFDLQAEFSTMLKSLLQIRKKSGLEPKHKSKSTSQPAANMAPA